MMGMLLLWILILNASLKPSESHGPEFDEDEDYEVVRPVRLHTVTKRDGENLRPKTIKYAMRLGGQDVEMHLEKNHELISKDYTETHYLQDGTQVTTTPDDIDHCYYQGKIVNDSVSSVTLSTCDGLRGFFRTSAQRYLIEPLSGDDEGEHAVSPFNEKNNTSGVCNVTNTSWSTDFKPPNASSLSQSVELSIVQQQKYLELVLVADNRMYQKMQQNQTELRKRIFEMVNFVIMVYKPLKTFVVLVGLEIWSNKDLISVGLSAGENLVAFRRWRTSELLRKKKHDNAFLLSGIDFEGSVVGKAYIGSECAGHSVGIVQDHNVRAINTAATLAHELGHNLGMFHDDDFINCYCSADSCIMSSGVSWIIPQTFSNCSIDSFEKYLLKRNPSCLLDKPDYRTVETPSFCGNGFVEMGEECDCGSVQECTNHCCNPTTCKLKRGSQCAEGECCENCRILPRTRECRSKQNECDITEYCDGKRPTCPADVFAVNGLPCERGLGYCFNGQCPLRLNQCIKMYGPSAVESHQYCYKKNTIGLFYGFCKRPSNDRFIPCKQQDMFCGKLFCHKGNKSPKYGRMVSFGDCKASFFDDYTKDYGQVDTGTKCGDGKVCYQNECVDLQTAYRNTNCSAKCPGHAVCNHRNECQCQPGWLLPYCDKKDVTFRELSTGSAEGITVGVLLVLSLGVTASIIGLIWKKQGPIPPILRPVPPPKV